MECDLEFVGHTSEHENKTNYEDPRAWKVAEEFFPGCSVAWDVQQGPLWATDRPGLIVFTTLTGVMVGCGDHAPFGWALWMPGREVLGEKVSGRWLFL